MGDTSPNHNSIGFKVRVPFKGTIIGFYSRVPFKGLRVRVYLKDHGT